VAETVANQLAIGLQHFRLLERTRLMAHSDLVTGLSNREHFMQLAEVEFEESALNRSSLGVIMLDIDFFKEINDHHGFQVGDDILREVGQRVRAHLINKHSVSTRYDGDEFVILMSVDSDRALWNTAEELRIAISNTPVASSPVVLKISTSVGIAFVDGKNNEMNLRELLNRASQALAQAKQNGRNCVWPAR
jgi:diguanylate cyclase (GGDEF)-like protein